MVNFLKLLCLLALGFWAMVSSCTRNPAQTENPNDKLVNLAAWSNYVPPALIAEFEKQSGIKVRVSNYSSNEELLAKLQAGASGYDVAIPSDYMVYAMIQLGLLNELSRTELPNFKHLDPKYLAKNYDSANKFSVPYDWGTTGIAVNRNLYKKPIRGWKDVFGNPELRGKFSLLDDVRETLGAALKSQGFSLNSKNPAELQAAKAVLLKNRSAVRAFTSEPLTSLVNGELAVAHVYFEEALQARKQSGAPIEYVFPEEGGTLWIDNLVIPKGATHISQAHQFINFLLEPKSNAISVSTVFVAPANKDAKALLPPELRSNKTLFPDPKVLSKFEMIQDIGDALPSYDRVWTEIKAQRD